MWLADRNIIKTINGRVFLKLFDSSHLPVINFLNRPEWCPGMLSLLGIPGFLLKIRVPIQIVIINLELFHPCCHLLFIHKNFLPWTAELPAKKRKKKKKKEN